jgi:hypothetical protein
MVGHLSTHDWGSGRDQLRLTNVEPLHARIVRGIDQSERWFPAGSKGSPGLTSVVVASYNTIHLRGLLIWSLVDILSRQLARIVVVDNGSTDGTQEFLREAAALNICDGILNEGNLYHGPALNQGISFLA